MFFYQDLSEMLYHLFVVSIIEVIVSRWHPKPGLVNLNKIQE